MGLFKFFKNNEGYDEKKAEAILPVQQNQFPKRNCDKEKQVMDSGISKDTSSWRHSVLSSLKEEDFEYNQLVRYVRYSTEPHDVISFTTDEEIFFKSLIKSMKEANLWKKESLQITRMSDKTFNVDCHTCYIGKIKLREDTYMQVLRGANQIKEFYDLSLPECLEQIQAWIRYIKYCRRN